MRYRIYENLSETDTTVAALFVDGQPVEEANSGQPVEVLLPETVFYVESGRSGERHRRDLLLPG